MLWSLVSGEPIALLDESYLYRFRTGVSAAVVARYLLPAQRVRRAAIIGAGPIAKQAAIAIHQLLDPEEIVVAARRPAAVEEFATTAGALGTPVHAALDIDAATDGADLLVTITSAKEELILPRHVGHTATILSMGGGPEVSHDVWQAAATRFVDDLDYALHQGDAAAWIASGAATRQSFEASLTGTVGDLAAGRRHGDAAAEGLRMAIIQGMTALDVALAYAVYQAVASKKKD
jgi:alanine dehydrogenase